MKYQSVDHLEDFEFHDAQWSLISCDSGKLVVEARLLNIHRHALADVFDCDMEIQLAKITFSNCSVVAYEPGVPWKTDASGKSYPAEPMITYTSQDAEKRLLHALDSTTTIYRFEEDDGGNYRISGCGDEPYFEAVISFDRAAVEWDDFRRPAWYVLRKRGIQA
ncbi:MAG: hypothetical protein IJO67_07925 [Clostridia bacterium]|nr:hypothetical protein [Clostridia bacterium]